MSIKEQVINIIAEQAMLEPGDIALDQTLDDIGLDSMGLVESIFAIEEAFDISVPFNANEPNAGDFDISSIGTIIDAVGKLMAAQGK